MFQFYLNEKDNTLYKVYLKSMHVYRLLAIKILNEPTFYATDLNFDHMLKNHNLKELSHEDALRLMRERMIDDA